MRLPIALSLCLFLIFESVSLFGSDRMCCSADRSRFYAASGAESDAVKQTVAWAQVPIGNTRLFQIRVPRGTSEQPPIFDAWHIRTVRIRLGRLAVIIH